jgi:CHAT domain-containing protein/tetratricopeptide (TPR) repeat protein
MFRSNRTRSHLTTLASLVILLAAPAAAAQTPDEPQTLSPARTLERELAGAQTHRYKFDLRADEFFQARVEQKGVDVTLKLLDSGGNALATMDSPNGKQGPETLTFVAARPGAYALEVSAPDAKAVKGAYTIRREDARAATAKDRRRVEVERLFAAGVVALGVEGQESAAFKLLSDAEAGWRELADEYMRKMTAQQAVVRGINGELQEAQRTLREGQKLSSKSRADALVARAKLAEALGLFHALSAMLAGKEIADRARSLGEPSQPLLNFLQALRLLSMEGEAMSLDATAQTYYNVGEHRQHVECLKLALDAYDSAVKFMVESDNPYIDKKKDGLPLRGVRSAAVVNLASSLVTHLGRSEEALRYLNPALEELRALYEETHDPSLRLREATALQQVALAYLSTAKDRAKGIESLSKALDIFRSFPDKRVEVAEMLSLIASQYAADFNYAEALKNLDAALEIYRELDNKAGQMDVLQFKGSMYTLLDDKPKVREAVNQALAILQSPDFAESFKRRMGSPPTGFDVFNEFGDTLTEYTRLDRIGFSYQLLEDYEKAIEYYEKALAVARERNFNPGGVRGELRSICYVYTKLKRWDKAYEYAARALETSRAGSVKEEAAADMSDVGTALYESGKPREALKYLNDALAFYQSAGVDGKNGFTPLYVPLLNALARTHDALGNRRMAIFYGKQGVNAIQDERRRLRSRFDAEEQKGFVGKNEKHYRRLADWLIEEGRLTEAEQVLRMLKEEEYLGFVGRGGSDAEKLSQRAEPNAAEAAALRRYEEISKGIAALGEEYAALEEKRGRTHAEQKRFDELAVRLEEANDLFQVFLKHLADEFAKTPKGQRVREENSGLRADLKRRRVESGERGVVALYTIVGEDRYRVILTTPDTHADGKTEIKAAELRKKIAAFREVVQNPNLDPRPLGKELYDILVKPIEKQLDGAKAVTLLWSLDDTLRYLPLAALWDGEQYFGQKYQNVVVTLASRSRLDEVTGGDWRVLGLGVSEARQVSLPEPDGSSRSFSFTELPGALRELQAIIRDETSAGAETGIMPGRRLMDSTFTEAALKESLGRRYKVVHIASHFSFRPGDLTKSFLLLGDGGTLTLNRFKSSPQLAFTGVELLTLSACDTAVGEVNADGVEVESFGVIAQDTGAKAVLATLWSVADESTQLLMSEFYRLRKENPRLTKAEALQRAQREMIEGGLSSASAADGPRGATLAGRSQQPDSAHTKFTTDKSKPYAHPFFWSPFVLIGNWK